MKKIFSVLVCGSLLAGGVAVANRFEELSVGVLTVEASATIPAITSTGAFSAATIVGSTSITSPVVRAQSIVTTNLTVQSIATAVTFRASTVAAGSVTSEGTITGSVVRGATVGAGVATVEGTLTGQGTITGSVVRGATVYSGTIMSEGSITGNTVQATVDLSTAGAAAGNVAMTVFATNMPVDCVSTGDAPSWLRVRIIGSTNYFVVPAYQVGSP